MLTRYRSWDTVPLILSSPGGLDSYVAMQDTCPCRTPSQGIKSVRWESTLLLLVVSATFGKAAMVDDVWR